MPVVSRSITCRLLLQITIWEAQNLVHRLMEVTKRAALRDQHSCTGGKFLWQATGTRRQATKCTRGRLCSPREAYGVRRALCAGRQVVPLDHFATSGMPYSQHHLFTYQYSTTYILLCPLLFSNRSSNQRDSLVLLHP